MLNERDRDVRPSHVSVECCKLKELRVMAMAAIILLLVIIGILVSEYPKPLGLNTTSYTSTPVSTTATTTSQPS
jgi:hypothetical protein